MEPLALGLQRLSEQDGGSIAGTGCHRSNRMLPAFATTMPLLASFWIAQADALYAVLSTTLLLAVVLLVLRPGQR